MNERMMSEGKNGFTSCIQGIDFYYHYHSYMRGGNWIDFEHKLYSWLANRVGLISSKVFALTIMQSCNAMESVSC